MDVNAHVKQIVKLKNQADKLATDNPQSLMEKIGLLAKCLAYIGRLSSTLDGQYKTIYGTRKYEEAKAHKEATRDKAATAEIAIREIRQLEAEAYERMQRWRNAYESTKEEIHSLKLKMRIDFYDGTNDVRNE